MAIDLGTYGALPPAGAASVRRPSRRGRRRDVQPPHPAHSRLARLRRASPRRLLATALAILAVTDALVLAGHAATTDAGPAAAVRDLFAALARGDGAAAAAAVLVPPGLSRVSAADIRTQQPIAAQVLSVHRRGATASVEVAYLVPPHDGPPDRSGAVRPAAAGTVLAHLVVRRSTGGLEASPRWQVIGGLPVLHIVAPPYETGAVVDGRPLPLMSGAADVTVLPGQVEVTLPGQVPAASESQTAYPTRAAQVTFDPPLDLATTDALSLAVSRRILPGGELPEQAGSVHPSHVDITAASIASDGATVAFRGDLDQLVRAQVAYNAVTLVVSGTATVATDDTVTVTALQTRPVAPS